MVRAVKASAQIIELMMLSMGILQILCRSAKERKLLELRILEPESSDWEEKLGGKVGEF